MAALWDWFSEILFGTERWVEDRRNDDEIDSLPQAVRGFLKSEDERRNLDHLKRREDLTEDEREVLEFVEAASSGNLDYVERKSYLLNAYTLKKECALVCAARSGHKEVVEYFVQKGGALHIDIREADGTTALMEAAGAGFADVVKILLNGGATVNLKDKHHWTAFHHAAANGNAETLDHLRQAGANVDTIVDLGHTSSLYLSAHENRTENVRYLLSLCLDPRIADSDGNKPSDVTDDSSIESLLKEAESIWDNAENQSRQMLNENKDEDDSLTLNVEEDSEALKAKVQEVVSPLIETLCSQELSIT